MFLLLSMLQNYKTHCGVVHGISAFESDLFGFLFFLSTIPSPSLFNSEGILKNTKKVFCFIKIKVARAAVF